MKYEIPAEPSADRVWTRTDPDGEPEEYRAVERKGVGGYRQVMPDGSDNGGWYRWEDLLETRGPVWDTHPELDELGEHPAPWRVSPRDGVWIVDARSIEVCKVDERLAPLIVRAVNAYAEARA